MAFGAELDGGLGSFPQRGTLLVAGRLPDGTGLANGTAGLLGGRAMILEVDPRTNYLRRALSDLTNDFAVVDFDTIIPDDLNPLFEVSITNQQITGLGRSIATFGGGVGVGSTNLVIQINLRALVNGQTRDIVAIVNGDAGRVEGDPPLRVVGPSPASVRDTAGEPATPAGSILLFAAPGNIDTVINSLFAQMAYSQLALNSGVVERLARNAILATVEDPSACLNSEALDNLTTVLAAHTDQRSGMGGAIFDFRNGLAPQHPCLAPGQSGGGFSGGTFFVYDLASNDVIERDLVGNQIIRFDNVALPDSVLDTTVLFDAASGHNLLLGVVNREEGNIEAGDLREVVDLVSVDLVTGQVQTRTTYDQGPFSSVFFGGLAAFGTDLYASGVSADKSQTQTGIFEIDPSSSTFNLVFESLDVAPLPALASARALGTLFYAGATTLEGNQGLTNVTLLEVDPRTNFLSRVFDENAGDFALLSGTENPDALGMADIASITGMTYVNNTLVINAVLQSGELVLIQYSPSATNSPSDPHLRRLSVIPQGNIFFGLAANNTLGPAASMALGNPTGPIEATGNGLTSLFVGMAYSAQAAASAPFLSTIRNRIAGSADNPGGCLASSELNGSELISAVNSHVNQRSGVGQAIRQFRNALPNGHPCGRGGA